MNMGLRTGSAIVLAFTFAIALAGLYTQFGPQAPDQNFVWALLSVIPVWIATGAVLYAVESPRKAVTWLAVANIACYAVLSAHAVSVG
jgi:hypothetical protein